jgi:hypothetical protein
VGWKQGSEESEVEPYIPQDLPFRSLDSHKQTALPMLRRLREGAILTPVREPRGQRPAILAFPELINIVEGHPIV